MEFSKDFFKEEERCGFKVTTGRKKIWAAELDILDQIKQICDKYHLKYFARSGTLLGAVRHHGFIPWDDDMDIFMWRDDYEIFSKIATSELKKPYFLQSAWSEEDYADFHIRVRNSDTTAAAEYDYQFSYNKGIFVDVFPLDKAPDDEVLRKAMVEDMRKITRFLHIGIKKFWYLGDEVISEEEKQSIKDYIEKNGWKKQYHKLQQIAGRYSLDDTKLCSYLYLMILKNVFFSCEDFEEIIEVPFENTTMAIPKGYDRLLTQEFGDYMTPVVQKRHGKWLVSTTIPYDKIKGIEESEIL